MNIKFIGVGSDLNLENSVGNELIKTFESGDYKKAFIVSAFTSHSAINGLQLLAENKIEDFTIITGIDQKGTSKEALLALLNSLARGYIFYNPSAIIFHPKFYFFEGEDKIKLILGSSNLTSQGLFQNMEASISLEINKDNEENLKHIQDFKSTFATLFDLSDPNLREITPEIIEELVDLGLIPTESERRGLYSKNNVLERLKRDRVKTLFPIRRHAQINQKFKRSKLAESINEIEEDIGSSELLDNFASEILVWQSSSLTERDLNVPTGTTTNPTGSMLFKKGETEGIDQRHFFRDQVFDQLEWVPDESHPHLHKTYANFQIIINDDNKGIFNLKLSHNTRTDSVSYAQKNSMTSISWGKAKEHIANPELLGKKLELFKKGELFIIKIK